MICPNCNYDLDDDRDDYQSEEDFYEDADEQQEIEYMSMTLSCTCGAYQVTKSGQILHVADCCCGHGD